MFNIFSAEYETAKEFIAYFHLKKNMDEHRFEVFRGGEVRLTVTGKGAVRAAMAAGYVMADKEAAQKDIFLFLEPGKECALICEIYSSLTGRYYYPDMCPSHPFSEQSTDDVQMAAWYEAFSCFVKQHQMVFAKTVEGRGGELCRFLEDFWKNYEGRRPFHHVYVERKIEEDTAVARILEKLPSARVVRMNHYKDIFNRKNQSLSIQKAFPALVLAKKEGQLIYQGSKECQNFGNKHFYYTSSVMNCLFDCEYCYLQGMYPSADVVAFINIEDIFRETDRLLLEHEVYLCISYDTDLSALEGLLGYCKKWIEYAADKENLTVELRTKAALSRELLEYCQKKVCENIIFAFTLTPEMVKLSYEHNTPDIETRLRSVREAALCGMRVRVCFDPIIVTDTFREDYTSLVDELFRAVRPKELFDVSLGEFRVPCDYLKRMRRKRPEARLLTYPFTPEGGSFCYGEEGILAADYLEEKLAKYLPREKIYRWAQG